MKILIVGGGIAGTTLAAFLQKNKKNKITLIDQAPKFGNIGFAIALWGNGQRVLKELGLTKSLVEKSGYPIPWDVVENSRGRVLSSIYFDIFKAFGPTVVLSRAELHESLISLLKNIDIRFGTTINKINNSENQTEVMFSDGKKETFDLVVGADGVHSKVRELVFGSNFLKYNGWRVWSFWIPEQMAHPAGAVDIIDDGKVYLIYPLYDKAVAMFGVTMPPKAKTVNISPIEDLHKAFKGFKPSVHSAIDAITDPKIFNDDINHVEMKDWWYKGRVILIGDAQHAISPITGMGASLALEDAFVLANELNKVSPRSISLALRKFSQRRSLRMRKMKKAAKRIDDWILARGFIGIARDLVTPWIPKGYFVNPIINLLKEKI